jgi:hypothetical protein
VTDNFFEQGRAFSPGGPSFTRIHQRFGTQLPLAFQEATIEQIANTLRRTEDSWQVGIVDRNKSRREIIRRFLHSWDYRRVLWFGTLAHTLAPDYPFYGLQAGLDGSSSVFIDRAHGSLLPGRDPPPATRDPTGWCQLGGAVAMNRPAVVVTGEEVGCWRSSISRRQTWLGSRETAVSRMKLGAF